MLPAMAWPWKLWISYQRSIIKFKKWLFCDSYINICKGLNVSHKSASVTYLIYFIAHRQLMSLIPFFYIYYGKTISGEFQPGPDGYWTVFRQTSFRHGCWRRRLLAAIQLLTVTLPPSRMMVVGSHRALSHRRWRPTRGHRRRRQCPHAH